MKPPPRRPGPPGHSPGGPKGRPTPPSPPPAPPQRPQKAAPGELLVNAYSETWLGRGFPWVYPAEVVGGTARSGEWLTLRGPSGAVLGRGLGDTGWLAVRRFSGGPDFGRDALFERLDAAKALRDRVVDPGTTGFRLCSAENDDLPGVRIDWWGHFAVIVLDSPSLAPLLEGIVAWLADRLAPRGVYLAYRPDHRETLDPKGFVPAPGLIAGHACAGDVRVTERGMGVLVRPDEGPDVGLYPDMREVRAWLEPHWGGKSVLNTFCYTGAFSVAAAVHGATTVTSVDLSERYLNRAEANFRANDIDPAGHSFVAADTFKALDRFRRTGERFDVVILDPPSFSHAAEGVFSMEQDYARLVASAARVLEPDGWLVAASNHGATSPKAFRGEVASGLRKADRRGQELAFFGQGPDFPALTSFPEGNYLKVGVWRVL
jgi:23S rRNA (cytosine1962-C5)-methyltransferase